MSRGALQQQQQQQPAPTNVVADEEDVAQIVSAAGAPQLPQLREHHGRQDDACGRGGVFSGSFGVKRGGRTAAILLTVVLMVVCGPAP